MLSINKYHDTIKHTYYNKCLMESVKKKTIKIKRSYINKKKCVFISRVFYYIASNKVIECIS